MLNQINIPANSLETPDSKWPAATEEQIRVAKEEAKAMAAFQNKRQHRNFKVNDKAEVFGRTIYICTGENSPIREWPEGTVYGFVVPGEPLRNWGQNPYWNATYKYAKGDSVGRRWLRFIMDPEKSPWRYVLRNVVDLDPDKCYDDRLVLFQHLDTLPHELTNLFMMAARWGFERPESLRIWDQLTADGIDPVTAMCAASCSSPVLESEHCGEHRPYYTRNHFKEKVGKDLTDLQFRGQYQYDHEPLTDLPHTYLGLRDGRYVMNTTPIISPGKGGIQINGQRPLVYGGYTMGFSDTGQVRDERNRLIDGRRYEPMYLFETFKARGNNFSYNDLLKHCVAIMDNTSSIPEAPKVSFKGVDIAEPEDLYEVYNDDRDMDDDDSDFW